ncbi:MAG TPA: hypothetical protein VFR42_10180, partial [Candidatus Acidoferrum sp.]|nr:hypothetical protein [Candidatus Acidoferrum sp.]
VLTINNLVRERFELRLSRASTENSDWCYLPLRHEDWMKLESEFGTDIVKRHLLSLPESWEELETALDAA